MRLTTVSRGAGMRLARDLPAAGRGHVPLLAHGTVLTERYQRALLAQELELPDGRVGVVARVDPAGPDVPVVRVAGPDGPEEVAVDTRSGLAP